MTVFGVPKVIYSAWFQGLDAAPDLVRFNLERWAALNPDYQLRILERRDVDELFAGSELPIRDMSMQALADVVRVRLLRDHGGVWVDAAIVPVKPLSHWLPDVITEVGFFAFERPAPDRPLTPGFMAATPSNLIFEEWFKQIERFWSTPRRRLTQDIPADPVASVSPDGASETDRYPYFWLHYLFQFLLETNTEFAKTWNGCTKINVSPLCQVRLNPNPSFDDIRSAASNAPMLLLDWRLSYQLDQLAIALRPSICLNMTVRNQAHRIQELLDAVAPHISSWLIVDTGSTDGTQDLIRNHLASLGIPGELHQRPWRILGSNQFEALRLAQGHGDYIWQIDSEDALVGTPDLTRLGADIYWLHCLDDNGHIYWRPSLSRDGVQLHWSDVINRCATWDASYVFAHLPGDYHIKIPQPDGYDLSGQKHAWDRDVLLAAVEWNPEDAPAVFHLATAYFELGDFRNARTWYARRTEMAGSEEEVYCALWRLAEVAERLDEPWSQVEAALLRAWEFRPTRGEPLYSIARHYRVEGRYQPGYEFASAAAKIPFPDQDLLFVCPDIYAWRIPDEQAVCASWIGKHAEAFTLWRQILTQHDLPDHDRQRIAANRDVCVPTMLEAASSYPDELVQALAAGPPHGDVTVSLIAGPDLTHTEHTLNSFLNCCNDISRIGRFLVLDAELSTDNRTNLHRRYGFLDICPPGTTFAQLRDQIHERFWLHLGEGWRFFAPENLITRLTAVLHAEPQISQVAINLNDATTLTATSAPEHTVRRAPHTGRYLITHQPAHGPAMTDTTRPHHTHTATLDEILCIRPVEHEDPR